MMPSRSVLLLVSCVTCLSSGRSAIGAQSNAYSISLPDPPVVEETTNLISIFPDVAIVDRASSPSPTQKSNLNDVLPSLDSERSKPTTKSKPKAAAKPTNSKSSWPLWWIGTGAVLVVVAGGLLYFLRQPYDDEREPVAIEPSSESDPSENSEAENSGIKNDSHQLTSHFTEGEQNGRDPSFWPTGENRSPEEANLPPSSNFNGHGSFFAPVSENPHLPESPAAAPANFNSQNNNVSPVPEDRSIEEPPQLPPSHADTLEVREPTRLAKINIVDELIKDLQNPDPTKRRKAIWELAQRGDSRAMQPLLELLIEADSKQRSLILEALSQIGSRSLKPMNRALAISLQDENAEVRKNAIRDLTRIYDMMAQVTQLLRHAVDDPDAEVQETARWALNQLGRIRGISGVDSFPNWPNSKNSSDN